MAKITTIKGPEAPPAGRATNGWTPAPAHDETPPAQPKPNGSAGAAKTWQDELILKKNGSRCPLLSNAVLAIRNAPEMKGALSFCELTMNISLEKDPPWDRPGTNDKNRQLWRDDDNTQCAVWLQKEYGIHVNSTLAAEAVLTVARGKTYHPIRDYLDRVAKAWDGKRRIETWLSDYLGAADDSYTRAVGPRWLISGVARIYDPGCKVDTCLCLEGRQGLRKSQTLEALAGEWFTDNLAPLGDKDAAMQINGVWIVELGELDHLDRTSIPRMKAYMSRRVDRFRPPYARNVINLQRQCVFAGSVNLDNYLKDETGARRFWPVRCGDEIRLDELKRDRDQLWAEAVALYRSGAPWWLESVQLDSLAESEQEARYDTDTWTPLIVSWIQNPEQRKDQTGCPIEPFSSDDYSVTVNDILLHAIAKPVHQWTQADQNRIAKVLLSRKWEKYRAGTENRTYRYRKGLHGL